jgi:hypothetical protein
MKNKKTIITILALAALMIFTSSCNRNAVEEPSPFGPSTYAVILNMSASPNVLFAGGDREVTTITTTLKRYDGMAIAGKTVHFDIRDAFGTKVTLGYFEGNSSASTQVTDQNGMARVNYYGPFAQELLADFIVYINAVVAWEGEEFITEFAPVYIVRDAATMTFTVVADPNVLLATETRPQSQIKAYFNTADGIPVAGRKVFFTVYSYENYFTSGGVFEGNKTLTYALTDDKGFASVTYYGPTKFEIGQNGFVTLKVQPETSTGNYIHEEIAIRILKDQ